MTARTEPGLPAYQPTYRRPIAAIFRRTAVGVVPCCVRSGVHPDVISYASIVISALAGWCFWQSEQRPVLLLFGPVLCYLRLWCNMLDGMVALASGKASAHGEILNDLPDRISDVLIFIGAAHSGLNHPLAGYWAAIGALLVAYVGTLGQAVGVQREYSGPMSKPWRMVVLHIGAWSMGGLLWTGLPVRYGGLTVLDWTLGLIVAGCVVTVTIRLNKILRALRLKAGPTGH